VDPVPATTDNTALRVHSRMVDKKQLLVLFKGHPASGKSTLARGVAKALAIPLVDKDDARDVFQAHASVAPQASVSAY
jgi:adenylylsulfate kinase-like enzyme